MSDPHHAAAMAVRTTGKPDLASVAHLLAPAAFGGLERVVSGLATEMASRGRRVILILVLEPGVSAPPWALPLPSLGVEVETIVVGRREYLLERRAVIAALRRHNMTVVHIHGERPDVVDGPAAVAAGFAVLTTMHGFTRRDWRRRLLTWLHMRAVRRFGAVVAVSRPLLETLRAAGVPSPKLVLIPNGILPRGADALPRAAARTQLGIEGDGPVIGWVGRVSREKGPDVMVATMGRIRSGIRLCIVGDGPESAACREQAARLGIGDRIVFAGARANAAALLAAFDVLALSSRTEGTPMVVLEAAAAGVPVVSTSVGGVPDVLGADGGWLVPSEDPSALAGALEHAVHDPGEAQTRAERLRTRLADQSTKDDWVSRYGELYDSLAARTEGVRP